MEVAKVKRTSSILQKWSSLPVSNSVSPASTTSMSSTSQSSSLGESPKKQLSENKSINKDKPLEQMSGLKPDTEVLKDSAALASSAPQSPSHLPPWARKGTKKSVILSEDGEISITSISSGSESPASIKSPTRSNSSTPKRRTTSKNISLDGDDADEESDFLLARLEAHKSAEVTAESIYHTITSQILGSFQTVRESIVGNEDNNEEIDWDFWGKLMQSYDEVARKDPKRLARKLHQGIPTAIRGMVWQLMCKGKDPALEMTFSNLLTRTSTHEKLIQRDLARTFPKHEYFMEENGSGQEALFNVVKAYSLYDPEVGYCQGISFIVGPLLLNMPEEEAFCCCVRLMKDYKFRELFTPKMTGLQTWLYQFDKVLEDLMPAVAKHLETQGILSTMYASQWFMTCFAYRFPLDMVFRIYDIVFAEGIEAMFRFGYALIKRNQDLLLQMEFESLLNFLKIGLFDPYINNITQLIQDASAIRLPKSKLDKLAADYKHVLEKSGPEHMEREQLRNENKRMHEQLRRLDEAYEQLNREHIALANNLISAKMSRERANEVIEELQEQVGGLKDVVKTERVTVEMELRSQMEALALKNLELSAKNAELLENHDRLEVMLASTKLRYAECENERQELKRQVDALKRALNSMQSWVSEKDVPRSNSPEVDEKEDDDAEQRDRPNSKSWTNSILTMFGKPVNGNVNGTGTTT